MTEPTRNIVQSVWYPSAWEDVAGDALCDGLLFGTTRCSFEWAEAIRCLGWCLRDAGMAAACEQRGHAAGRSMGFKICYESLTGETY